MDTLTQKIDDLPIQPGVYLFKNSRGKVLYVGKATSLRARVRQYFAGHDSRQMVPFLVSAIADLEVIVTNTPKEALLLENTLIKKHRPRFNVKLRDDSNYLHLRLDLNQSWPRYRVVRNVGRDRARYFGPYTSAAKARQTLAFLQRIFPLRTCTDSVLRSRSRPCLLHQMGRCAAPCVDLVDETTYGTIARDSMALLDGRTHEVIRSLRERMTRHAAAEEFELAAQVRDLLQSIEATVERQEVIDPKRVDRDVWGVHRDGWAAAIACVPMREGVMSEPRFQHAEAVMEDDAELLSSVINSYYADGIPIPGELLVSVLPSDADALAGVLSERKGRKVSIHRPERGRKVSLVDMAVENARVRFAQATDKDAARKATLEELAEVTGLPSPPTRMECFDNSHLGGTNPVAAMAVFIDGQPDRQHYRRYKIKTAAGDDDYAGMREILTRRFKRAIESGEFPDLLVVDGGKGQLGVALAVLEDLGRPDQPAIGISKPRNEAGQSDRSSRAQDRLVLPGIKDPLRLPRNSPVLRMLQHLRDESHKHAITYQRKSRRKSTLASALEEIPGIGPARRKALLTAFGSLDAVADATPEQIAALPGFGPAVAHQILEAFTE